MLCDEHQFMLTQTGFASLIEKTFETFHLSTDCFFVLNLAKSYLKGFVLTFASRLLHS